MTTSMTSWQKHGGAEVSAPVTDPPFAFIGKAGSGKSTAAQYLAAERPYRRVSFADPIREMARMLWGEAPGRDKHQRLGVAIRDIDENAWLNVALRRVEDPTPTLAVVVDDCRFPNEYWALRERGFVFVRVECDLYTRINRLQSSGKWQNEEQLKHISETALDGSEFTTDYTITNNGIIADFEGEVRRLYEREWTRR